MRQEQEFKSLPRSAHPALQRKVGRNEECGITYSISLHAGRNYMDQPGQPQYLLSLAPCCLHFYDKKPYQHVSHRGRYCNQASQACPVGNADFCDCCSPLRCLGFNWQPQNTDVRTHSLESLFCYPESLSQLLTCSIWQVEKKKEKKIISFPISLWIFP